MSDIAAIHSNSHLFDQLQLSHRTIVHDLVGALPKFALSNGRRGWTEAVKELLKQRAQAKQNHLVFYGTSATEPIHSHEWLLDAAWYFRSNEVEGILLALESEWNHSPNDVAYDFSKLLAVKAPLKIMLFEDPKGLPAYIDALDSLGRKWLQHAEGDVIYAINFSNGKHVTFYEVRVSGSDLNFKLGKLDDLSGDDLV